MFSTESSLCFSFLLNTALLMTNGNILFAPHFLLLNFLALIAVCIVIASTLFISIQAIAHRQRKTDILKGNTSSQLLLVLQMILKYAMLSFAAFLFVSLLNVNKQIDIYMASNESWFQTENIHKIKAKFVTNDLAEKRELELQAPVFYQELERSAEAFLINSKNYDTLSTGQLVWEANSEKGLYSSAGKSITVNANYLKRHSVLSVDGQNVLDKLDIDPMVRNLLVPVSLKVEEAKIYAGFLEDFKFQKIDVPQIYQEEIGEVPPVIDENTLQINIIYVPDDLAYFVYNKEILPENGNLVCDPIVIVDTGHLDPGFYFAWLTSSVFFESNHPEPFTLIRPISEKHNLLSSFHTTESIFNTRADEVQTLSEAQATTGFVLTLVLSLMIFFIYLLSHSYFEQNKYSILVKYIAGYSLSRIYRSKLIFEIVVDILVLMLFGNIWIATIFVAIDVGLTYGFSLKLYRVSTQNAIKGGL